MANYIEFGTREDAAEWLSYLIAAKDAPPHVRLAIRSALLTLATPAVPVVEQDDHK